MLAMYVWVFINANKSKIESANKENNECKRNKTKRLLYIRTQHI